MIKRLLEEFRETFSDIWGWTIVCIVGCIPGFGIMVGAPVLGILKVILRAIYLEPVARWLCSSMYQDAYYANLLAIDLIRIWIISYVLISLIRFVYSCYADRRKVI